MTDAADPPGRLVLLANSHTYRADAFKQAAARLQIPVVEGVDLPPPLLGDTQDSLAVDYRDIPRSVRRLTQYAARRPIQALIGLDDSGALLAARASEALGLPHNEPAAVLAARDKHLMRQRFAAAGLPSPLFRHVTVADDPAALAQSLLTGPLTYPCVLKPTSLAGSRGVMRADNPQEFQRRFARLRRILQGTGCADVLVEAYIPGVEVALEGLLDDGELRVLALFDKPDPLEGPFFEETIYVTPSRLPAGAQQAIAATTAAAAAALGLRRGPVHAELRWNEQGPWLVEVAARSIGGRCSQTLRFGTDVSLEELILRQSFGLPLTNLDREALAGGVMMLPIPESGVLRAVHGVAAAQAVPLIEEVEISAPLNQPLQALPEGNSYLGFIFARGPEPAAVEAALRQAHAQLSFAIDPTIPLLS